MSAALRANDYLRKDLGVDPILIGSYGRDVSIRRVKDVDVFARLTKAGSDLRPGEVMDKFEGVLVSEFGEGRDNTTFRMVDLLLFAFEGREEAPRAIGLATEGPGAPAGTAGADGDEPG